MSPQLADLLIVRDEIDARAKLEAELKQKIQQRMADASRAIFETGSVSFKRSKDSSGFDLDALLKDQPSLRQQYSTTKPGSRRFLIIT